MYLLESKAMIKQGDTKVLILHCSKKLVWAQGTSHSLVVFFTDDCLRWSVQFVRKIKIVLRTPQWAGKSRKPEFNWLFFFHLSPVPFRRLTDVRNYFTWKLENLISKCQNNWKLAVKFGKQYIRLHIAFIDSTLRTQYKEAWRA